MVATRSVPKVTEQELVHGIPIFLDQLIETLTIEQSSAPVQKNQGTASPNGGVSSELAKAAALHGRDLLEQGFTVEQVVRDYGDVCQAVTNLAFETGALIEVDEFRTFNRCLDNAIAAAVGEYAKRQAAIATEEDYQAVNSRLGPLAHELRNYLQTAILVVRAIKAGNVGISGATGAVLDRSLLGMRNLIDRSLAEVRVTAGMPARLQPIRLGKFLDEVAASSLLDAQARGCRFTVTPVDDDLTVYADPEMLSSAVGNLLQNAFKFTQQHSEVQLKAYVHADRILIDVEDHCGGLPSDTVENLLLPFAQGGEDRSGLGLGLDICRRGVEINQGVLRVRNVPGSGCVFTIDLPRHSHAQALDPRFVKRSQG
jgi:signal transduction histidine kinase